MTHDEMIAVIQAHKDGKQVQHRRKLGRPENQWGDSLVGPGWNFAEYDYRVKPEPREWWLLEFPDGTTSVSLKTRDEAIEAQNYSAFRCKATLVREVLE